MPSASVAASELLLEFVPPLAMSIAPGDLIDGKYRVIRLIGQGGMGAVYEGQHTLIERRIAIKVLFREVAAAHHGLARFEREARAAGRIGNDHILEIFDIGALPDGSRYMVSEFLDGETLSGRLQRLGRMTPEQIAPIMAQLLDGLAAAHHAGVLHRDLKPDNIFLLRHKIGRPDFVKIIDFGISKFQSSDGADSMRMTATGAIMGTPYYLSPEQARGSQNADARSDLYAAGVIMYECVTGKVPFDAANFNELIFKIALETPPSPRDLVPELDPAFSAVVQKAMARDPRDRYQSAEELTRDLAPWAGNTQTLSQTPARSLAPQATLPLANTPQVASAAAPTARLSQSGAVSAATAATQNAFGKSGQALTTGGRRGRAPLLAGSLLLVAAGLVAAGYALTRSHPVAAPADSAVARPVPVSPASAPAPRVEPVPPPPAVSVAATAVEPAPPASAVPSAAASVVKVAPKAARPARPRPPEVRPAPSAEPAKPPSKSRRDFGY